MDEKMTVERAVALIREIGRRENEGTGDDWADWDWVRCMDAMLLEVADAANYLDRAAALLEKAGNRADLEAVQDIRHDILQAVQYVSAEAWQAAVEQAAADADVDLAEIEPAVDGREVESE